MALRDWIQPYLGVQQPEGGITGELKDSNNQSKKEARRAAQKKGRGSLLDSQTYTPRVLPLKKHIKERIPLRPEYGRPWYKTYKIQEEAGPVLSACTDAYSLSSLMPEHERFMLAIESSTS